MKNGLLLTVKVSSNSNCERMVFKNGNWSRNPSNKLTKHAIHLLATKIRLISCPICQGNAVLFLICFQIVVHHSIHYNENNRIACSSGPCSNTSYMSNVPFFLIFYNLSTKMQKLEVRIGLLSLRSFHSTDWNLNLPRTMN